MKVKTQGQTQPQPSGNRCNMLHLQDHLLHWSRFCPCAHLAQTALVMQGWCTLPGGSASTMSPSKIESNLKKGFQQGSSSRPRSQARAPLLFPDPRGCVWCRCCCLYPSPPQSPHFGERAWMSACKPCAAKTQKHENRSVRKNCKLSKWMCKLCTYCKDL